MPTRSSMSAVLTGTVDRMTAHHASLADREALQKLMEGSLLDVRPR
jgi:hypothetical protein